MKKEYDLLLDMLADIREEMSDEDFIDDNGYDRLGSCVGSPVEVVTVMKDKMDRLERKNKKYEQALNLIIKNTVSGHVENIAKKALNGEF